MKTKQLFFLLLFVMLTIFLTGCADVEKVNNCLSGHTYGFFGGLWHGIIAPLAFIGSLLSGDIAVWAVNNNGAGYTFGFLLGFMFTPASIEITNSSKRKIKKIIHRKIISQSFGGEIIAVAEGETPVINSKTNDISVYATLIVNFLRCGCPQVQIFSPWGGTSEDELSSLLENLQVGREEFFVDEEPEHIFVVYMRK